MTDITPLSADALATLVEDFEASDHNRMAMNAVTAAGINKVARNYDRARLMQRRFSTIVDNGTATHQDRSGRCWLFSSLNVARFVAKKNMGLKEFEFSQNYAMYYDKLERVNYFLQDVAELVKAGEPSDSRLIQHLLADVMGDGGQWTMAMNRVQEVRCRSEGSVPGNRILQEHRRNERAIASPAAYGRRAHVC